MFSKILIAADLHCLRSRCRSFRVMRTMPFPSKLSVQTQHRYRFNNWRYIIKLHHLSLKQPALPPIVADLQAKTYGVENGRVYVELTWTEPPNSTKVHQQHKNSTFIYV